LQFPWWFLFLIARAGDSTPAAHAAGETVNLHKGDQSTHTCQHVTYKVERVINPERCVQRTQGNAVETLIAWSSSRPRIHWALRRLMAAPARRERLQQMISRHEDSWPLLNRSHSSRSRLSRSQHGFQAGKSMLL
jgi:hypothetical protein